MELDGERPAVELRKDGLRRRKVDLAALIAWRDIVVGRGNPSAYPFAEVYSLLTARHDPDFVGKTATLAYNVAIRGKIAATDYYVSPCDHGGKIDFATAKSVLSQLDGWSLSVQLHKIFGFK